MDWNWILVPREANNLRTLSEAREAGLPHIIRVFDNGSEIEGNYVLSRDVFNQSPVWRFEGDDRREPLGPLTCRLHPIGAISYTFPSWHVFSFSPEGRHVKISHSEEFSARPPLPPEGKWVEDMRLTYEKMPQPGIVRSEPHLHAIRQCLSNRLDDSLIDTLQEFHCIYNIHDYVQYGYNGWEVKKIYPNHRLQLTCTVGDSCTGYAEIVDVYICEVERIKVPPKISISGLGPEISGDYIRCKNNMDFRPHWRKNGRHQFDYCSIYWYYTKWVIAGSWESEDLLLPPTDPSSWKSYSLTSCRSVGDCGGIEQGLRINIGIDSRPFEISEDSFTLTAVSNKKLLQTGVCAGWSLVQLEVFGTQFFSNQFRKYINFWKVYEEQLLNCDFNSRTMTVHVVPPKWNVIPLEKGASIVHDFEPCELLEDPISMEQSHFDILKEANHYEVIEEISDALHESIPRGFRRRRRMNHLVLTSITTILDFLNLQQVIYCENVSGDELQDWMVTSTLGMDHHRDLIKEKAKLSIIGKRGWLCRGNLRDYDPSRRDDWKWSAIFPMEDFQTFPAAEHEYHYYPNCTYGQFCDIKAEFLTLASYHEFIY